MLVRLIFILMFIKPNRWAVMLPTFGGCLICTEMYGSGAAIGMGVIPPLPKRIPAVRLRGRLGCFVGVAGTSSGGIAGRRTATAAHPPTATTALVSGWSSRVNSGYSSGLLSSKGGEPRAKCPEGRGGIKPLGGEGSTRTALNHRGVHYVKAADK